MLKKILTTAIVVGCGLIVILLMQRQQQIPAPATPAPGPAATAEPSPALESHPVLREDTPASPAPASDLPVIAAASETASTAPLLAKPPQLDGSDASVLQAAAELSPQLAGWLLPPEQLRKWVALVNLVAEGKFPVKDRPLSYELQAFRARKEDNRFWLEPLSFQRKDALVSALTAISPQRAADYFHAWEPLLQNAHDELGNGGQFRDRLKLAIARVNAVQPLQGETELKVSIVSYLYKDEALEKASALEKLLWRLGPDNSRRLQDYLRTLEPLL